MSHYAVAVFANSPREFDLLLEPYSEQDETYYTFHPVKNEDELKKRFEEKIAPINPGLTYSEWLEDEGYYRNELGILGYSCNDNAKWDWYTLDGRDYMYELKSDAVPEEDGSYRKNDYIYEDDSSLEEAEDFWEKYVLGKAPQEYYRLYKPEYYLERYGTKEQYLKEAKFSGPYAFVTPDGVWHAPGNVGWFACSDETAEEKNKYMDERNTYIASEDNPYVSFVDCHI